MFRGSHIPWFHCSPSNDLSGLNPALQCCNWERNKTHCVLCRVAYMKTSGFSIHRCIWSYFKGHLCVYYVHVDVTIFIPRYQGNPRECYSQYSWITVSGLISIAFWCSCYCKYFYKQFCSPLCLGRWFVFACLHFVRWGGWNHLWANGRNRTETSLAGHWQWPQFNLFHSCYTLGDMESI